MLIGFVGDVHGRVFHMVVALVMWQRMYGRRFDLIVQVGDMGAYPSAERMDSATRSYLELDPAEGDFARLLAAEGPMADRLLAMRDELAGPTHFIHGNHDDIPWLEGLLGDSGAAVNVDPFDLLRYVRDGTVLDIGDQRLAFLGGEDRPGRAGNISEVAYARLMELEPGGSQVLVTHDAPFGLATGRDGQPQGSRRISTLIERLQPRFHVAGHYHHLNGPRREGKTTSLALSSLVASRRWKPDSAGLQPGCIAVLDVEAGTLTPVTDPWLTAFPTPFDFGAWLTEKR
jgi:Icc-related predicted phosphoesterase